MKKWVLILFLIALLQGMDLIPRGKEMEELTLITALAVDRTGEEIRVTAVTGTRQSQGEETEVLTGRGQQLSAACRDMELSRPTRAYLGQTRQLLLGEELTREGWGGVFDQILAGGPIRLDTLLYIVRGQAGSGLAESMELTSEGGVSEKLRGKTTGEVLSRLSEGERTLIPVLAPGGDGALHSSGWAAAGEQGVSAFLEGDGARGAELLSGLGKGNVVTFPRGSVELRGSRCRVFRRKLICRLTGKRTEGIVSDEELAAWGERCIRMALEQAGDCWSLECRQRLWGGPVIPPEKLTMEVIGKVEV